MSIHVNIELKEPVVPGVYIVYMYPVITNHNKYTSHAHALYFDRRDVAEPLSVHPHQSQSTERCFYMCGPSFCSRLVVEKHFETFTTFFPPAPSTAENAPKVKQGKMEKRVTTFFSPEV